MSKSYTVPKPKPASYTVHIRVYPNEPGLSFDVRFPDGYFKAYKLDEYEVRAHRMAPRDLIENLVLQYYQDFFDETPDLKLVFY